MTSPNPIVLENQKPGTPESVWQIDPGDDFELIQGFTTAISTNRWWHCQFQNRQSDRQSELPHRYLSYGLLRRRRRNTRHHSSAQAASAVVQPAPLTDPSTGLVDAGNWSVTDSWTVPTTATSGVYVANVIDGSQVFQIPFIIRNDSSHERHCFPDRAMKPGRPITRGEGAISTAVTGQD